jgi:hypothetical protein
MPAPLPLRSVLLLTILALALSTACSDDNPAEPKLPTDCAGLSNVDCAAAQVRAADQQLETILYTSLNGDPQRPADVDVRQPLALYKRALTLDPTNKGAHFGAAVLGLLALSSDDEINAAFDEWKAYLDQQVPFETQNAGASPSFGVPLTFRTGRTALALPFDLAAASLVAQARGSMTLATPQLSRVQAILRDRVLPRLAEAKDHLGAVASDPGYQFIVTPRMQGDEDASPAEIDRTDILALRAGCGLLEAVCHTAVSYELNFAAYDSANLVQAFTPGSGWMTLRGDGAGHMGDAKTALLGAVDDVDAAINSLEAEQDDQDNDVIKTDPYDFNTGDLDSIQAHLPDVRAGLNGGYTRVDDWDSDSSTPKVSLTIQAGALFTNPIDDWKALFPPYTVTARRAVLDHGYQSNYGTTTKSVTTPYASYFSASFTLSVYDSGQVQTYFYGDDTLRAATEAVISERYEMARSQPAWDGYFYGYASFYGYLEAGTQDVAVSWYESYGIVTRSAFVPVITWDAATFDQWVWPDPTLHGLLPAMGSSAQLLETFGVTSEDWQREVVLDWTDVGNFAAPSPSRAQRWKPIAAAPRTSR